MNHIINRIVIVAAIALACGVISSTGALAQGPLDPPGAPAPTMKTLDELSAQIAAQPGSARTAVNALPGSGAAMHVISQPGSYYLTDHITGVSSRSGIHITASHVTLDLNGFSVVGVAGAVDGIRADTDTIGIAVFNGVVRSWPERGVNFELADNILIRDVRAIANTAAGIHAGERGVVTHCTAMSNGVGILTGISTQISHCSVSNSTSHGIATGANAVISHCAVTNNGGDGIRSDLGANISHCSVRQTSQVGIRLRNSISLTRDGAAHVSNCTVSYSGLSGGTDTGGILSEGMAVIVNNTITDCRQTNNTFAIHAENDGTRIDGNMIAECEKAIVIKDEGNMVVRNTFHNCDTLFDVTGTNFVAPTTGDPTNALANNSLVNIQY